MGLPDIRLVPMDKIYIHEEIFRDKVKTITKLMDYSGVQKNPLLTVSHKENYIVIDGMHRTAALRELGCRMAAVCVYDYNQKGLNLYGWSVLFYNIEEPEFIELIHLMTGLSYTKCDYKTLVSAVRDRFACFGFYFKKSSNKYIFMDKEKHKLSVEDLIAADKMVMVNIEEKGIEHRFISDTDSLDIFKRDNESVAMMIRPLYTKSEVVEYALKKKLFPQKSTRHEIPDRPLWLNIPLALLRADIPLAVANDILRAEISYRWKRGRIRHYPESVYIYDD